MFQQPPQTLKGPSYLVDPIGVQHTQRPQFPACSLLSKTPEVAGGLQLCDTLVNWLSVYNTLQNAQDSSMVKQLELSCKSTMTVGPGKCSTCTFTHSPTENANDSCKMQNSSNCTSPRSINNAARHLFVHMIGTVR